MASSETRPRARERGPTARLSLILTKDFCAAGRAGAVHKEPRELKSEEEWKNDMMEEI
jgi:hypothetical protein